MYWGKPSYSVPIDAADNQDGGIEEEIDDSSEEDLDEELESDPLTNDAAVNIDDNPALNVKYRVKLVKVVERERTPRQLMEFGIRPHPAGLSLSDTVRELEKFGVERSRKAVHDWVRKCDLQPAVDETPNHVEFDETVIQLDEHRYWLSTAVDPQTNKILHIRLYSTTTALTERFLQELMEKHDLDDAMFLVDGAKHLQTALRRSGLRFRYEKYRN